MNREIVIEERVCFFFSLLFWNNGFWVKKESEFLLQGILHAWIFVTNFGLGSLIPLIGITEQNQWIFNYSYIYYTFLYRYRLIWAFLLFERISTKNPSMSSLSSSCSSNLERFLQYVTPTVPSRPLPQVILPLLFLLLIDIVGFFFSES